MKNIKFIMPLLLVSAFSLASITSCNKGANIDTDFDGLTDNIDPDPKNNEYKVALKLSEETESGELDIKIDYRDFLESEYKRNLGLLSSFFVNEVSSTDPYVHNNVYPKTPTEESKISPMLAQIGGKDIVRVKIADQYKAVDRYDVANLVLAHHTFTNENQKYQIYFVIVQPYVDSTGWISNFDLGAVKEDGETFTESYVKLEGDNHPDWTNHIHHKGFDTTTNRLLEEIKTYQEAHNDKDAKQITLVTGHSRGGAIANLIGKYFVDHNQEVRAYCFNSANVTLEDDSVVEKEEYTTHIFNLINNDDLVSNIPTKGWGFKLYGQNIAQTIDEKLYTAFMKQEYTPNTEEGTSAVVKYFNSLLTTEAAGTSRNNMYEFRDRADVDDIEYWEGTKDEMDELHAKLHTYFPKDSYAAKCFDFSEVKEDGYGDYYITYETRPAMIKALMTDIINKNYENIASYMELLSRVIDDILDVYLDLDENDFTIEGVVTAHIQPIACVMAEQYQKNNN